jgi:HD-like signal output (HDOD) protein
MDPNALTAGIDDIVSLPESFLRINELLELPTTTTAALGEVVAHDPGLTSRILKLVNSAAYGLPSRVDTLSRAIALIGTEELRNIALATSAISAFKHIPQALVDMDTFWNHSVQCALTARALAERSQRALRERVFVAGLLHALGQLVMYFKEPELSRQVLTRLVEKGDDRCAVERAVFGCDHAEVGAGLLRRWHLPESLAEPVQCYPRLDQARHFPSEAALVHIGAAVADAAEPGVKSIAHLAAAQLDIAPGAWAQAGVDHRLLKDALADVDQQWFEVLEILTPGGSLVY